MSRYLTFVCIALLGLFTALAAEAQIEAELTLSTDAAQWNDVVRAKIEGIGSCGAEVSAPFISRLPGGEWVIDIDLTVPSCPISAALPFSVFVDIGPLPPEDYTVRLQDSIRHVVSPPPPPIDTASLSVYREASVDIELPAAASDAEPFRLLLSGPASSSCFMLDPPVVQGNSITARFDDNCPILPIPGPYVFEEEYQIGPLAPGEYQVKFFEDGFDSGPRLRRKTLIVHDADGCVPSATSLCLQDGRFRVEVDWNDFEQHTGVGHAVPLASGDDSGLFWFFQKENIELTVKALDGCSLGGYWWIFIASGSTVEYTVTVTDTATGRTKEYEHESGVAAPRVAAPTPVSCVPGVAPARFGRETGSTPRASALYTKPVPVLRKRAARRLPATSLPWKRTSPRSR